MGVNHLVLRSGGKVKCFGIMPEAVAAVLELPPTEKYTLAASNGIKYDIIAANLLGTGDEWRC